MPATSSAILFSAFDYLKRGKNFTRARISLEEPYPSDEQQRYFFVIISQTLLILQWIGAMNIQITGKKSDLTVFKLDLIHIELLDIAGILVQLGCALCRPPVPRVIYFRGKWNLCKTAWSKVAGRWAEQQVMRATVKHTPPTG
eukprot:IDg22246t1